MRLLQDNKSGVYVDLINDGGESALDVNLMNDLRGGVAESQ